MHRLAEFTEGDTDTLRDFTQQYKLVPMCLKEESYVTHLHYCAKKDYSA